MDPPPRGMKVLKKIVGKTKIERILSQQSENPAVSNQLMSGWKEKRMGRTCNENECSEIS